MTTYEEAGVNIKEGYRAVELIKKYAASTLSPLVLNNIGSFGAFFELPEGYKKPVLISGTDGVGTKLKIASARKKYDTVGIDCVAMCVNDILCHGARPLFFLDYIACGKLDSSVAASIVKGIAEGCRQSGASLIGGETAEMPGFYDEGEYDVAGFAVGIAEKEQIIDGQSVEDGDSIIGLSSSGLHSNGFSLVRSLIKDFKAPFLGREIGEVLLEPTKIYVKPILTLLKDFQIKSMCHITGGGFIENVPRMLPAGKTAVIDTKSYPLPKLFSHLIACGVKREDMYNTFNMGIGFMLCVKKEAEENILNALSQMGQEAFRIGHIESGEAGLCLK